MASSNIQAGCLAPGILFQLLSGPGPFDSLTHSRKGKHTQIPTIPYILFMYL